MAKTRIQWLTQKKGADEKTQLSEEALKKVSGGSLSEAFFLSYEEVKFDSWLNGKNGKRLWKEQKTLDRDRPSHGRS